VARTQKTRASDTADVITADLVAVLVAVTEGEPRIMTIANANALPSGPFEFSHRSLQTGLRAWVEAQTGHPLELMPAEFTLLQLQRCVEALASRCLDDAVLIKDNQIALAGDIGTAVARAKAYAGHLVKIEVEVDTLSQLERALALGVDAVLLDNMSVDQLKEAIAMAAGKVITEASGGITAATAPAIAAAGVDLISVGWLTHSAAALDIGLDYLEPKR